MLFGLFDSHFAQQCATYGSMRAWYLARRDALAAAERRNPRYARNFRLYRLLADLVADKAEVGIDIHRAYAAADKAAMRRAILVLEGLLFKYDEVLHAWEEVWLSTNKPFGFDVISTRLGGTRGRIAYAIHRLGGWVDGQVPALPELEEPQLPFDGRTQPLVGGCALAANCQWGRIVTACPM